MKKLLSFALSAILLTGCDSFNEESDEFTIPPKPGDVAFTASVGSDISQPGSLDPADFGFGWQAGDEIHVALDDASAMQPFTVAEVGSDGKAVLTGEQKWPDFNTDHRFFARYGGVYTAPHVKVPGPDFTADGTSTEHVRQSLFLFALPEKVASPGEDGPEESQVELEFHNVMSVIQFRVATVSRAVTIGGITVETENAVFPTDGRIDVTASGSDFGKVLSTQTSNVKKALLTINGNPTLPVVDQAVVDDPAGAADDKFLSFWLPLAAQGATGSFTITVGTSAGGIEFPVAPAELKAGRHYVYSLVVDASQGGGEWDGVTKTEPRSEGDTYYISTGAEFAWFGANCSNAATNFEGKTLLLTNDIDLGGKDWGGEYSIGGNAASSAFKGTLDGQGFSIRNLRLVIGRTNEGLFRSNGGVIKNLTIASGEVVGGTTARTHIGVLVGRNDGGAIINCHNYVDIEVSNITTIGGIVGMSGRSGSTAGYVERCTNHGNITVTASGASRVGGIVGYTENPVSGQNGIVGCVNYGDITGLSAVGGICGHMKWGTMTACYNVGKVTGTTPASGIGGVVGTTESSNNTITACYNIGLVSGETAVGGVCGSNPGSTVRTCYWGGESASLNGIGDGKGADGVTRFGAEGEGTGWPTAQLEGWTLSTDGGYWLDLRTWSGGGADQQYPELAPATE